MIYELHDDTVQLGPDSVRTLTLVNPATGECVALADPVAKMVGNLIDQQEHDADQP